MALKTKLNERERFGLTDEEIKLATRYLRKHKTAGQIAKDEAAKVYEMFLVGCTFVELAIQFPQYTRPQIILTCALQGWIHDREKMVSSLKDRVQAKVVKSVIEQVDFLTMMLSVTNTEHLTAMKKYIEDPKNNPPPDMRITSIKEYRETLDALNKLIAGANGDNRSKTAAIFQGAPKRNVSGTQQSQQLSAAELLEAEYDDE